MQRQLAAAVVMIGLVPSADSDAASPPTDDVLFRSTGDGLFDGAFGPLRTIQDAAAAALKKCGSRVDMPTSGRMNAMAQVAFRALAACPEISPRLNAQSEARHGAVTEQLWKALVSDPIPDAAARARTIMLTFEATDYTALEWNFCQSRPIYNPPKQPKCFSNDPHSFITWGPNGATAGGGREVQAILGRISASSPEKVKGSFGPEAAAINRLLQLDPASQDTEVFLCGVWADSSRRKAWQTGFRALGADRSVRDAYDLVYRSKTFDGGKIATFTRAYTSRGLMPSEADFAFFKDRSAHMGIEFGPIDAAVAKVANSTVEHWRVRRQIALDVRPPNQRADRLGRDIAFYVDGLGPRNLSKEEAAAWTLRGKRRVSDVGLSDAKTSELAEAGPPIDQAVPAPVTLSAPEQAACPAAVLKTQRP